MPMNGHDPLHDAADPQRELFARFTRQANGFATEHVLGAAANLIINAIRQAHPTQRGALVGFDEMCARVRALLAEHYDVLGKRRNVFAFHQVIQMPHFDARNKEWK